MAQQPFDQSLYQFDQAQPSYWEASAPDPGLKASPLASEESCEVAIIGGGFTGLSAALHLARDFGIDTRVLEAGHFGWGASGRNGGFCSIGGAKLTDRQMAAKFGMEEAKRYFQAQVEAVELVRQIGEEEEIDFLPQGDGEITIAHSARQFESLKEQVLFQRDQLGLDCQLIERDQFAEEVYDIPHNHGGLRLRPTFGLHPLRYAQGLAAAVERRGAILHPRSQVLSWEKQDGWHHLKTAGGKLRARQVFVCCNGFMPEDLHSQLTGRVLPAQSNIIVTRPLSDEELTRHKWKTQSPVINAANVFYYFRLLSDNRFLFGGRGDSTGRADVAPIMDARLKEALGQIWPQWSDIEITHSWRGLVAFTRDLRPAIGRFPDDPSVTCGFGYHGNGVNTATWTGKQLAYWLAGSNMPAGLEPEHLPVLVRGLTRRFFLPNLRRFYLRLGLLQARMKDIIAG